MLIVLLTHVVQVVAVPAINKTNKDWPWSGQTLIFLNEEKLISCGTRQSKLSGMSFSGSGMNLGKGAKRRKENNPSNLETDAAAAFTSALLPRLKTFETRKRNKRTWLIEAVASA